jgi:pyrimidine-nucleoside phosphorylase
MRPQEIIAKKRDGAELTESEIDAFIEGVCDGFWADYQVSALLMAMFTRGLTTAEQASLTYAMLHSGEVLDLSGTKLPKADKHSTGGVGDKTSFIIAPVVAACGVAVPMISGRGLGHTGGTLDKLESIPGYNVNLTTAEFTDVLDKCGFAMMGQTDDIVPADKRLYALRDATATVPYIPLIVASIMSKKLAEGLDALVLDVKTGSGAFMQDLEDAILLANAMVKTGRSFGVTTQAVVSDMGQPLGSAVGNAVEVAECIRILKGDKDPLTSDLRRLSVDLSARMLVLSRVESSLESAVESVEGVIASGEAFERFKQNCELQGGDPASCDDPKVLLDNTLLESHIKADIAGSVEAVDALAIGEAVVEIGGGRVKAEDSVDHRVGYVCKAKIGDKVGAGDTLGILYYRNSDQEAAVRDKLNGAYRICDGPVSRPELIKAVI